MKRCVVSICAAALILAGCQTTSQGTGNQNQQETGKIFGALLGAAVGAFLGSKVGGGKGQLAAIAAGALLGAMAGSAIFESLSRQDQTTHNQTRALALEETQPGEWKQWENPDAGTAGLSGTKREFANQNNDQCKEMVEKVVTPEGSDTVNSVYCKNSNTGEWQLADVSGEPKGVWQPTG